MTGEQLVKLNEFLAAIAMAAMVWVGFVFLTGFIHEREMAQAELEKMEQLRQIVMYESECGPTMEMSPPVDTRLSQL